MKNRLILIIAVAVILALIAGAIIIAARRDSASPGRTVYITDTGKRYHRGTCDSLRLSKHPISIEQAIRRGYTPCKRCKPGD